MMMPNPFFPPFRPMRNYNNPANYNVQSQKHYSPNINISGHNNTYNSKTKVNKLNYNGSTYANNFSNDFNTENIKNETKQNEQFFEIFGIKLFFDDLLIIALLFFLYKEECTDDSLFIILIILLLS